MNILKAHSGSNKVVLFLWYCEQEEITPLRLFYPVCWPALNYAVLSVWERTEGLIFYKITLDQPASICSLDKKPQCGHFQMVQKEMLFPPLWIELCMRCGQSLVTPKQKSSCGII